MNDDDPDEGIMNGPRDPHGYGIEVPPVTRVGPFTIGHVDRIHGEGGRPCPEYIPTRHELETLARHWMAVYLDHQMSFAVHGQTGSVETREILYAQDRLDAIAALIGGGAVDKILAEENARLAKEYGVPEDTIYRPSDDDGGG